MPICKHLKPVGECPECRPKGDPWKHISPGLVDPEAPAKPKPKFGLVRDAVQKINGKAKAKGRKR